MKPKISRIALVPIFLVLSVEVCRCRSIRDETNSGLLLSALCFNEGQMRKACLEDVSTLSIQRFFDKLLDAFRDSERYNTLIRDLDLDDDKGNDVIPADDVVPEKRGEGRSRQVSGFYSNW